ncbi:hypothetical protein ACHAP9_006878 [Verticillium nonalfalfae]
MERQFTSPQLATSNAGTDSPGFTGSAPSASVAKRNGRKGSRKVRTGCITCKIRRVKCDEVKPACERCTKTGRGCDGYAITTPSVTRAQSQSSPLPSGASIARTMSPFAAWDANDQRAFHYYRNCSATSLFTQATSTFWARIVPALCFEEPAVRYAVLVISNLHQSAYGGNGRTPKNLKGCDAVCTPFAAGQYGKALRSLQQWRTPSAPGMRGTASVTVPLLTCLLFICIEFMLGDMSAAMVHIIQGRAILAKLAEDPHEAQGPAADLIRRELVPVYTRLSVASFVFGAKPVPIPTELRPQRPANIVFDRLEDAELSLHEIIDDGLRFAKDAKALVARIAMRIVELEETRALTILGKDVPEPPDSRHAKAYIPARDKIQNFLKNIPGNRPPSIPHEEAEWIFEAEAAGPVPEGDVVDVLGLPDNDDARSSPFHIPEAARVMNADISPRVSGGSWVTFWVVPQMEGELRWDVIREFVARGTQESPILNRV